MTLHFFSTHWIFLEFFHGTFERSKRPTLSYAIITESFGYLRTAQSYLGKQQAVSLTYQSLGQRPG